MNKIRSVLLIDDDAISSWLNQTLLEKTELIEEVVIIAKGKDAITFLHQNCSTKTGITQACPDLILLDLDMPVVSGFDVLEALKQREDCSWVMQDRLVVLTTTINPKDLRRAKTYPILDFLVKPLTDTKLNELLKQFIQRAINNNKPTAGDRDAAAGKLNATAHKDGKETEKG